MSTKFPGYRFLMIGEVVEPGDLFVGSDGKTFESEMIGWAVADPYGGKYIRREPATPAPESPAPAREPLCCPHGVGESVCCDCHPEMRYKDPEVGTGSETSPDAGASREALAALCHEQWSGWMRYLFDQCEPVRHRPTEEDQQTATAIPEWAVERWRRQMDTAYADLSEEEKESDRKEADRIRCLLAKPADASEAEQIPHPVAEAEQSPVEQDGPSRNDVLRHTAKALRQLGRTFHAEDLEAAFPEVFGKGEV